MGYSFRQIRNPVSIVILLCCVVLYPIYQFAFLDIYSTAETEHCPMCYGKSLCPIFHDFALNWKYFFTNLINMHGEKVVLFGTLKGDQVVLKVFTVDSTASLNNFNICNENISLYDVLLLLNKLKSQFDTSKFQLCPSTDKLDTLLTPIKEKFHPDKFKEFYLNLCHMIQVNIEPLIQQVIKDWAVAEYLGSCGRIVVSKYCGDTLTWMVPKLNWTQRALITQQLLQFAFNATFEHPNFAFYFTDLSPDNIAISSQDEARLVDLEHVIVVDKYPLGKILKHVEADGYTTLDLILNDFSGSLTICAVEYEDDFVSSFIDEPANWNVWHQSYHDDSVNGFAFSPQEVCSHQISDLNIYAVCQGILSEKSDLLDGGLLYSPPEHMSHVRRLVQECISPSPERTRFDTARAIIKVLDIR